MSQANKHEKLHIVSQNVSQFFIFENSFFTLRSTFDQIGVPLSDSAYTSQAIELNYICDKSFSDVGTRKI